MPENRARGSRLVIVSNRLPFQVESRDEQMKYQETAGGLVTGLSSYLARMRNEQGGPEHLWVGWPGSYVEPRMQDQLTREALERFRSVPVYLSEEEIESFYYGFCNETVWPLFHYFPGRTVYRADYWQRYQQVNEVFRDAVLGVLEDGDVVWVHDYHLMLLPLMLKERAPATPVGYFHHIPFPSFEIFRLLPGHWRRRILEGLLGSDLIGFHTFDYSQHFLQSVLRILGYEQSLGNVTLPGRVARVDTFPMGIDFEHFWHAAATPEIQQERATIQKSLPSSKLILSVDRLDYSKGILNRLLGFETLMETNPALHGKVVLIMIVVPSRTGVEEYRLMKKQVEEQVGRINGRFGAIHWTPVIYEYHSLSFEYLVALYSLCDVALVTPLRDGMNLVAKEYIATRTDRTGVLVLSEMAGASKEMGEAIIVNPNNREEIAQALKDALDMPLDEQRRRNTILQARLKRYDVRRWANDFVGSLKQIEQVQSRFLAKLLPLQAARDIREAYRRASRRVMLLDYDGTLVPFAARPNLAVPPDSILRLLQRLTLAPGSEVVLISGRDRETLQRWFGEVGIHLVAEHGVWLRSAGGEWRTPKPLSMEWKPNVFPILELYCDRLPGSFLEEKGFAIAFHYRGADPEQSSSLVGELKDHLASLTANIDIQILQGHKVVEVRTAGVDKGSTARHWLASSDIDFILALGDDWTDEDLFAVLPEWAFSVRVGITTTRAKFNVRDHEEAVRFLETLAQAS
jgi:trehalose 6-phosphate synthase/phosphatase